MKRTMLSAAAWAVAVGALSVAACGEKPPPPVIESRYSEPRWQDVFDTMPELFAVVRPRALRQDKMYGVLLRRAIEAARQQSRVVAATRALEAMEDADEIIAGVRVDSPNLRTNNPQELVLVARGVGADVDPGKLVDADGRSLWTAGPAGAVRELVRERDEHGVAVGASLFELPGRTWLVASGDARVRAREVLAHPTNRPAIEVDPEALAFLRLSGPSLVQRVRPLQATGGLAAVGRRLQSVALVLPPGKDEAIRATLSYADEDAAAFAEVAIREAIDAVARTKREGFAWLGAAKVDRPDKRVVVTAPLPRELVDALLRTGPPKVSDGPP